MRHVGISSDTVTGNRLLFLLLFSETIFHCKQKVKCFENVFVFQWFEMLKVKAVLDWINQRPIQSNL